MSPIVNLLMVLVIGFTALASINASADQSISPRTYKTLNEIQTLLADNKHSEVSKELKELEENLSPGFGLALTYQIHAQLFLAKEDSKNALIYFNKALALDTMKAVQAVSLATNVAQLHLASDEISQAISVLKPRILAAEEEQPDSTNAMAFITLGSAYQLNKEYRNAVTWLKKGISRSDKPRENWLQMLMASHYQLKQYSNAVSVLDQLININSDKEDYWLQQASLYQIMNKPYEALKVLQLANVHNVLEKESGLITLVQLLIAEGVPERAGRVLLSLLEENKIELTESNWKLLASAWLQGRERQRAIEAFVEAAELSLKTNTSKKDAADLYYRIAQIQFDSSDFSGAISSFSKARELGITGKKVGLSLLMQGNSFYELENYQQAKVFFSKALKEPSSTNSAKSWIDYMQQLELL